MNRDPLRNVTRGEPVILDRDVWNHLMETARWARGKMYAERGNVAAPQPDFDQVALLVQNDSGGDLDAFSVVQLGDPVILPADNLPAFRAAPILSVDAPDGPDLDRWGVILDAIPDGSIGRCAVAGIVPVEISVSDAAHDYAEPDDGVTGHLVSTATQTSAFILWKESGTGTVDALVRLGVSPGGTSSSPTFSGVILSKSGNQTITNNTETVITFASEEPSGSGYWSSGDPNKITFPTDGYYHVGALVTYASLIGTGRIWNRVRRNATAGGASPVAESQRGVAGFDFVMNIGALHTVMTAGDYIELVAWNTTGGNEVAGSDTKLWAYKIADT